MHPGLPRSHTRHTCAWARCQLQCLLFLRDPCPECVWVSAPGSSQYIHTTSLPPLTPLPSLSGSPSEAIELCLEVDPPPA